MKWLVKNVASLIIELWMLYKIQRQSELKLK